MFRSFYKCETTARQLTAADGLKRDERGLRGIYLGPMRQGERRDSRISGIRPGGAVHLLVINSGSSSIKFSLFDSGMGEPRSLFEGEVTGIGGAKAAFHFRD